MDVALVRNKRNLRYSLLRDTKLLVTQLNKVTSVSVTIPKLRCQRVKSNMLHRLKKRNKRLKR